MTSKEVIVVFDIGKTNKKVLVYDRRYQLINEFSTRLQEVADKDGFHSESIPALTNFIYDSLDKLLTDPAISIKAINASAYGASLVYMSNDIPLGMAVENYLKPFPEMLAMDFYDQYGGKQQFSIETASPSLGSLNAGLQLYRRKMDDPDHFEKCTQVLHLPQFIAWLIHKNYFTEITSLGCHTALWDYVNWNYHHWVLNEALLSKLAPIRKATEPIEVVYKQNKVLAGTGMHDSSAALVPYLKFINEPFALLSTGTWCITLNPFNDLPLTEAELEQDVVCYITHEGKQIKASRLFGGAWHEDEVARIGAYFHCKSGWHEAIPFESSLIVEEERSLDSFPNASSAYHYFMHRFVKKQVKAIRLVTFHTTVQSLLVDGGFSHNTIFLQLLKQELPELKIKVAIVPQGSSLGAALVLHDSWNSGPMPADLIKIKSI